MFWQVFSIEEAKRVGERCPVGTPAIVAAATRGGDPVCLPTKAYGAVESASVLTALEFFDFVMSSEALVGEHFPNDEPLNNRIHLEAMQGAL